MAIQTADDIFTEAKWIVDATAGSGTHTTIASAITSASAGDTIFIRPGTYTENLTLKVGVNLTAWPTDSSLNGTGTVIISGNATLSTAGSVTISGIQLQTNSAALLTVSGSVASIVNLYNCYLNCSNNTGITYSSSSATSAININNCSGNLGTTGIGLFTNSSTGNMNIYRSLITNTGSSTTASTSSNGFLNIYYSSLKIVITTSSTAATDFLFNWFDTSNINTTSITVGGTGANDWSYIAFDSGNASAVSISTLCTLSFSHGNVETTNPNAITGAGTLSYSALTLEGSGTGINTTGIGGGTLQGYKGSSISIGYLGEQLTANGTAVACANGSATNIASINLTAGIWDVSCIATTTGTGGTTLLGACVYAISVNSGSTAGLTSGIQMWQLNSSVVIMTGVVPVIRATLSTTTTYYLVATVTYGGNTTAPTTGRITATRVG